MKPKPNEKLKNFLKLQIFREIPEHQACKDIPANLGHKAFLVHVAFQVPTVRLEFQAKMDPLGIKDMEDHQVNFEKFQFKIFKNFPTNK